MGENMLNKEQAERIRHRLNMELEDLQRFALVFQLFEKKVEAIKAMTKIHGIEYGHIVSDDLAIAIKIGKESADAIGRDIQGINEDIEGMVQSNGKGHNNRE